MEMRPEQSGGRIAMESKSKVNAGKPVSLQKNEVLFIVIFN